MRRVIVLALALLTVFALSASATGHAPSGAIFTTLEDGTEVNLNQFPDAESVYLDGGPGPGAPQTAAGLDDGTYVFQVTNPSGKRLLSTDLAKCRRFTVANGIIAGVVAAGGCEHATGFDVDHSATTVQLFPFDLTPNPGGVFKVWATFESDFLAGCTALGESSGLDVVDCGNAPGNRHGFVPRHSKTDNFKVKITRDGAEIDVHFFDDLNGDGHLDGNEESLPHVQANWTDTVGATNVRYANPEYRWGVFAHVESPEPGMHYIHIFDSDGCQVGQVHIEKEIGMEHLGQIDLDAGPQTVEVEFGGKGKGKEKKQDITYYIDVACTVP